MEMAWRMEEINQGMIVTMHSEFAPTMQQVIDLFPLELSPCFLDYFGCECPDRVIGGCHNSKMGCRCNNSYE